MVIGNAQNSIRNETLKNDLIFISVNFSFIVHTISTLETTKKKLSINESMQIVKPAMEKLKAVSEQTGVVKKKIHAFTGKKFRLYWF